MLCTWFPNIFWVIKIVLLTCVADGHCRRTSITDDRQAADPPKGFMDPKGITTTSKPLLLSIAIDFEQVWLIPWFNAFSLAP